MPATEETLRRELEEAFRGRAHLYRLMLDVLEERMEPDAAEEALAEACRRRGREVAAALFDGLPATAEAVARRFLQFSPDGGDLYPHDVAAGPGVVTISVRSCPLQAAWRATGLRPERIAQLCRIAGEFDRALFEAAGISFENSTWTEARGGGCCRITLRDP